MSAEQIMRMGVCHVNRPYSKGGSYENTPYDERMGVIEKKKKCLTCGQNNETDSGHFGYIILAKPVYHPKMVKIVGQIASCLCFSCYKLRISDASLNNENITALKGLDRLAEIKAKCQHIDNCENCNCRVPKISSDIKKDESKTKRISVSVSYDDKTSPLSAEELYNKFILVKNETFAQLGFNLDLHPDPKYSDPSVLLDRNRAHLFQTRPEDFILTVLPVSPPRSRPRVCDDNGWKDDELTEKYNTIVKTNNTLLGTPSISKRAKKIKQTDIPRIYEELQQHICTLFDNNKEANRSRAPKGFQQRINGKHGHALSNVVSKRSDFSARAVIVGGGPYINSGEIGVPFEFTRTLTRPIRVTKYNILELQFWCDTDQATAIVRNGNSIRLSVVTKNFTRRFPIQVGDVVDCRLRDGWIVLFNRQPTLRVESMKAMRCRIFKSWKQHDDGPHIMATRPENWDGSYETLVIQRGTYEGEFTFRLSECDAASFNADYDGKAQHFFI
jgi:DNA-directed RNA polymerase II subunit RPB1